MTLTWSLLPPSGNVPPGRFEGTMQLIPGPSNKLLISGSTCCLIPFCRFPFLSILHHIVMLMVMLNYELNHRPQSSPSSLIVPGSFRSPFLSVVLLSTSLISPLAGGREFRTAAGPIYRDIYEVPYIFLPP